MKKSSPFPLFYFLAPGFLAQNQNNISPETFTNLQCKTGFICVDLNLEWAKTQTNDIERDISFGNCKYADISRFSDTSSNPDYNTFCIPWETKNKTSFWVDCGADLTVEDEYDENLNVWFRFLVYSIEIKVNTLQRLPDGSFSDIVTVENPIYVQPASCRYQSKGYIMGQSEWIYVPQAVEEEEPNHGEGDFTMTFFVGGDDKCEYEVQDMKTTAPVWMCIFAYNITDPNIVIIINKIWATPTTNPNANPSKVYFDGGCSFSDKVHDNTEGEHDLREVVKTAVPLSAPERFAGFPTMNYHVDVEICMTGECGVPCETLAEGRTALGRSIFPDIDLRKF